MKTLLVIVMVFVCVCGWTAENTESEHLKQFKDNMDSTVNIHARDFKSINKDLAYYKQGSTAWKRSKARKDELIKSIQTRLLETIESMPDPDKTAAQKYYDSKIETLQNAGTTKNGKTVAALVSETCKACDGKGQIKGKIGKCECCKGTGQMEIDPDAPLCQKCHGNGKIYRYLGSAVCPECKGTGKAKPKTANG